MSCLFSQVKSFYVGENFVGDIPLSKKILAGLTTGVFKCGSANKRTEIPFHVLLF